MVRRPKDDLRRGSYLIGWMGFGVRSNGPHGVYASMHAFTGDRSSPLMFFPLDSRNSFPIVDDPMAAELGASLAPNGRTLLYSHVVTDGADLVLLDHFK